MSKGSVKNSKALIDLHTIAPKRELKTGRQTNHNTS